MLGAVSLLAPLPAAYFAFIVPTGLAPALRLAVQGDKAHLAMGLMAGLFTLAMLMTAKRIHLTILSSLNLEFESKRAAATLSESEERFRNMANTTPVMIWVSGPDKLCTFLNTVWLRFTGPYPRARTGQRLGRRLSSGRPGPLLGDLIHPLFDAQRDFELEIYRFRRADGEYRWLLKKGVPRLAPGGVFAGYIGSCIDITELKRTQEENFARQKLDSVGTLAAGIAHDFNNLLGAILAQAELAQEELTAGLDPKDELERIRDATIRGSEIVRELMIYAGKERDPSGPVDVSGIVSEMLELLKVSVSKHAVLEIDLGINLPAVQANAAQLRQVVMNLITNASEALGDQDGVIRVTTKCVTAGGDFIGTNLEGLAERRIICNVYSASLGHRQRHLRKTHEARFLIRFSRPSLGAAVLGLPSCKASCEVFGERSIWIVSPAMAPRFRFCCLMPEPRLPPTHPRGRTRAANPAFYLRRPPF